MGENKSDIIKELESFDSPTISDAMDKTGLFGSVYHLKQLTSTRKIVGQVLTVQLEVSDSSAVNHTVHLGAKAIDSAGKNSVIVVDNQGKTNVGAWGGLLSIAARQAGVCAVIVDGALRDVDEIQTLDFPVYAISGVPTSARNRVVEVATNEPVNIGKVRVDPRDYVIGDASGIVFIPGERIETVLHEADVISKKENAIIKRLKNGASVSEALNTDYENMLR